MTVEQNLNTYVPDFKNTVWTFSHRGDLLKIKYENESSLGSWQLLSSLLNNHHADEKLSDMTLAEMFTDQVKRHLSFLNFFFLYIHFCFLFFVTSIFCYRIFVWPGVRTDSFICVNCFFVASLHIPLSILLKRSESGF